MRLINISDIHCHELLARVIQWILRNCDPANTVILVHGDLTNNGFQHEYEFVFRAFAPIMGRFTIIFVPGNHDYGVQGNSYQEAAMKRWVKYTHVSSYPTKFERNDFRIIGLDTCIGNVGTERAHFASGEIGPDQLGKLDKILATPFGPAEWPCQNLMGGRGSAIYENIDGLCKHPECRPGSKTIIVQHHHIVDLGIKDKFMELDDAEKERDIIRGRVDLVIHGHRHIEKYRPDYDGIRILGCPSTPAAGWFFEVEIKNDNISIRIIEI